MTIRRIVSIVAIAGVSVLGFGAFAFAQSGGPPWMRGWGGWEEGRWGGWHEGRWGPDSDRVLELRSELAADLAAELDTTGEDVEAAFRAVVGQRLDEAVQEGRIDQEEADEALAGYDDGELHRLFRAFKRQARESAS